MRKFDVTRRDFLRTSASALALSALPSFLRYPRGEGIALAQASKGILFDLGSLEYRTIDAAVSRLIPDDQDPGAGPARVVDYINRFVGAFEDVGLTDTPFIFAGGPFSDRNPAPDPDFCGDPSLIAANGAQSDDMSTPVALSPRRMIAWKARILGTAALGAEGNFIRANNQLLGEGDDQGNTLGLRYLYLQGVQDLNDFSNQLFGKNFEDLDTPVQQDVALNLLPNQDFVGILFEHAVEGMYANPEYGGNQPENGGAASGADGANRPLGWKYIGYEGDRQPLGYTIFDEETGTYCEFPDHPVSGPNPLIDAAPLTAEVIAELPELVKRLRLR